jgi:integrase
MYRTSDGTWHASINLGIGLDGKRRRRHVRGRTQGEVRNKLDNLKRARRSGDDLTEPRAPTVGEWAKTWIEIVERSRKPSTTRTYRTHVKYLEPIRRVRLDNLTPEHIEAVYVGLVNRGVSPVSVQGVHRTLRSCFGEAVRRGKIDRNPATAARPERAEESEVEPLSIGEARAIMAAAAGRRNAVRWTVALGIGLRQGEVLGLQWDDIDFEAGILRVRRALQQGKWRHGRASEAECGLSAQCCPQRFGGGLIVGPPKSRKGSRTITLAVSLLSALRGHKSAQAAERLEAGTMWRLAPPKRGLYSGSGRIFASPIGKPIDPRRDWEEWKRVLADAGVRDARLHDARHTAATFLLVAGVDTRTVMDLLGWSQPILTVRYQHVVDELKQEAVVKLARRVVTGRHVPSRIFPQPSLAAGRTRKGAGRSPPYGSAISSTGETAPKETESCP